MTAERPLLGLATTRDLIGELEVRASVPQNPAYQAGRVVELGGEDGGDRVAQAACLILRAWFADAPGGLGYRTVDG